MRRVGAALAGALALAGCTRAVPPETARPALLTKDDILLVDRRTLSLADFLVLRERMARAPKTEVVWAATAVLALQNEWQGQGKTLPPEAAWSLVRGAQGEARKHLEELVARSVVQKNERALAGF